MFHLIRAESALELVPNEIKGHPAVRNQAQRSGKKSLEDILDGTFHHSAMRKLPDGEKRGRPDIIHLSLLIAQGSILNRQNHLRTYIHTMHDELIEVSPTTRLPRNIERFKGVMAQLLAKGEVNARSDDPQDEGAELLKLTKNMTLEKILAKIAPDKIFVLNDDKEVTTMAAVLNDSGLHGKVLSKSNIVVMMGGFPHGDFQTDLTKVADKVFSIYHEKLELWTVVANVLMDMERAMDLY